MATYGNNFGQDGGTGEPAINADTIKGNLQELQASIQSLSDLVTRLEGKINPVLIPKDYPEKGNTGDSKPHSEIWLNVEDAKDDIHILHGRIDRIIDRLEI